MKHPEVVSKLVLLGPPPSPVPEPERDGLITRASSVRKSGMAAVVNAVVKVETSTESKIENPLAIAATRISLLGQDPEGYAKGCTALAGAIEPLPLNNLNVHTLIVTGDEDKVSPPAVCENYAAEIKDSKIHVLPQVGHWHIFEDVKGVAKTLESFL